MAGKFRRNSSGIHRNDQNPTGIGGALIRPHCTKTHVTISNTKLQVLMMEMRGKFEAILYKVRNCVKWEVEKNSLSTATD